jgi:hypothetical protein
MVSAQYLQQTVKRSESCNLCSTQLSKAVFLPYHVRHCCTNVTRRHCCAKIRTNADLSFATLATMCSNNGTSCLNTAEKRDRQGRAVTMFFVHVTARKIPKIDLE